MANAPKKSNHAVLRLSSPHLPRPMDFTDSPKVVRDIQLTTPGWEVSESVFKTRPKPFFEISRGKKHFHWHSDYLNVPSSWKKRPPKSSFGVLCELHFEWSDWFIKTNPDHFVLHAGAVEFGDGIVIFPSDQKAGKSVLTMQCAARGYRVFSDDVIAISPKGRAVSLGLAPRLRMPLPKLGDRPFEDFVKARRGPSNEHYQYMALNAAEFAGRGVSQNIAGFVTLERKETGTPELSELTQGQVLKQVIRKNFAEDISVDVIFSRLKRLTGKAKNFHLRYASGQNAIDVLAAQFGGKA